MALSRRCEFCNSRFHHTLSQCAVGMEQGAAYVRGLKKLLSLVRSGRIVVTMLSDQPDVEFRSAFVDWLRTNLGDRSLPFVKFVHCAAVGTLGSTKQDNIVRIVNHFREAFFEDGETHGEETGEVDLPEGFFRVFAQQTMDAGVRIMGNTLSYAPLSQGWTTPRRERWDPETPQAPTRRARRERVQLVTEDAPVWPLVEDAGFVPINPDIWTFAPFVKTSVHVRYQAKIVHADPICSVCLTENAFIQTNCKHDFCSCIATHMTQYEKDECPMCRTTVTELKMGTKHGYEVWKSAATCFPAHFKFD